MHYQRLRNVNNARNERERLSASIRYQFMTEEASQEAIEFVTPPKVKLSSEAHDIPSKATLSCPTSLSVIPNWVGTIS